MTTEQKTSWFTARISSKTVTLSSGLIWSIAEQATTAKSFQREFHYRRIIICDNYINPYHPLQTRQNRYCRIYQHFAFYFSSPCLLFSLLVPFHSFFSFSFFSSTSSCSFMQFSYFPPSFLLLLYFLFLFLHLSRLSWQFSGLLFPYFLCHILLSAVSYAFLFDSQLSSLSYESFATSVSFLGPLPFILLFLHLAFFSDLLLYPLRVSLLLFSTFLVFLTKCCSSYAVIFSFTPHFTHFFILTVVFLLVIYPTFIFPSLLFPFVHINQTYTFFASRLTSNITRQHFLMLYKQPIHNIDCTILLQTPDEEPGIKFHRM